MLKRNELIENNVRLVHACCKRFAGRGIEYDDIFQVGCIGLMKAADGFDESRGLCFSTYAVPTIIGEIKRLFRDSGAIKVSRSVKELSMKITRETEKLEKHGCEATVNLLAERLGVTCEEIVEAIEASRQVVSLTFEGEDGVSEIDLPTESHENKVCSKIMLDQAISRLNYEEREIIKLRFWCEKTQTESAKILGISQVQVSRKEKRALEKLRIYMN
ncbi:MAG: sigma-70 family RNA polymerase sigma factor [Acutalibacteraceae bacterium]|nr:sigma-70 family RNA polymerase sigma factor [Acutalibacteraceae bacterium]